ncbi:type I-MYXAN CRISPR-associated protein Cas6/Cmx6 [Hydrogenophaga sp.]|uniref:type I-MYXAN CRISPR-associated protein Cas6/Cmx6 n=1 Tax=Hydrogenophaga sp. TaxID=1904254 RepID=UPI002723DC25|nr:type I-MYXAN CRISPR-associated protein Cas6/Cmx6 [Hydrogenophaga sp.]MDO9251644.1 type I-MYXAN CRISPR-associated protein Cas6/Cmx6 [Hydrogenophaga sp.]MDP3324388.1 type I-MYXAN CRISPR-associated protein Cas6/Cmx6 [Hydrogenophaga sp.]MDP3885900.1 type I-MYXAN CRISPR-associated protein Cas6/Cmx6 [Hydrogenophaga sp.]
MSVARDNTRLTALVDLVFPLNGHSLPRESAPALRAALQREMPWLDQEPLAGIHPLKLVPGNEAEALLSQRTRLLLRLPRERMVAAIELAGRSLQVGGQTATLGLPHPRELLPHHTLYAYAVAAEADDEIAFVQAMNDELQTLQVRSQLVCGKRQQRDWPGGAQTTFSLMLHGLSQADSLLLQEHGLGRHRLLGCGIFVPHKSAAAVGE